MLLGIVFNRTPFFRGKDNYDQLRRIAEVMGSEDLDRYIAKYQLRLDRETLQILGRYEGAVRLSGEDAGVRSRGRREREREVSGRSD